MTETDLGEDLLAVVLFEGGHELFEKFMVLLYEPSIQKTRLNPDSRQEIDYNKFTKCSCRW